MYRDIFGPENFFIEIQDHGIAAQHQIMDDLLAISREVGAPLLATNDSHYTYASEADAHDACSASRPEPTSRTRTVWGLGPRSSTSRAPAR